MATKPRPELGIRTDKDAARALAREQARLHWAEVDEDIALALGEEYPAPSTSPTPPT